MADKLLEVKNVSKIFRIGGMLSRKKIVAVDDVSIEIESGKPVILSIVGALLNLIPVVGWVFMLVMEVIWLVLMILGIVNAAKGEEKPLPIIGNLFTLLK